MRLQELRDKLSKINESTQELKDKLQEAYNDQFNDWGDLQALINHMENRTSDGYYHYNECGDIEYSISFELELLPEERKFLDEYLSDYCIYLDTNTDTLSTSEGDSIVMNDSGDVFDGHKCIINATEYETEIRRNFLIEEYMEKTGCFPGVFESDRNGILTPIDTQNKQFSKYDLTKESEYVVGVIGASNVDWDDVFHDSIDIGYIEYMADAIEEYKASNPEASEEDIETHEEILSDDYCGDSTTYLIGDWIQDKDGKYSIDKDGKQGFSATFNSDTNNICVEFSKTIMQCHHTSLCYRMVDGRPCGDLDTEGDSTLAYSLPVEMWR